MTQISQSDLLTLSDARLAEARTLLATGLWSGAYYLAGYALEFRLKSRIATRFLAGVIPDRAEVNKVYTHNLMALVTLAGLGDAHREALRTNQPFAAFWSVVNDWDEQSRYRIVDQATAEAIVAAIIDPDAGVMQWLARYS